MNNASTELTNKLFLLTKQLRDAMKGFKKDKYESIPFKLFDFEYWATAKIQNKLICDSILPD